MKMKVCTNQKCRSKGKPLEISNFHKKGAHGLCARCKNCVNTEKRMKRKLKRKKIENQFTIGFSSVDKLEFVEGLKVVINGSK